MASSWPSLAPALGGSVKTPSANSLAPQQNGRPLCFRPLFPGSDFEAVSLRINPPRVVFDNKTHPQFTLLQVDSANRYGCLLEVVQLLTDLGLYIVKAFLSSDGGWFIDEFHVTDGHGQKLEDEGLMLYIKEALGARNGLLMPRQQGNDPHSAGRMLLPSLETEHGVKALLGGASVPALLSKAPSSRADGDRGEGLEGGGGGGGGAGARAAGHCVRIEMTGVDRPGLLSDVSTVLAEQHCNVLDAQVWTHNRHVACVVHVTDAGGSPVSSESSIGGMSGHVAEITEMLRRVMKGEEHALPAAEKPPEAGSREGAPGRHAPQQHAPESVKDGSLGAAHSLWNGHSQHMAGWGLANFSRGSPELGDGFRGGVWAEEEEGIVGASGGTLEPGGYRSREGAFVPLSTGAQGHWEPSSTRLERRLHQLLAASEDYSGDGCCCLQRSGGTTSCFSSGGCGGSTSCGASGRGPAVSRFMPQVQRGGDPDGREVEQGPGIGRESSRHDRAQAVVRTSGRAAGTGGQGGGAHGVEVTVGSSPGTGYLVITIRCPDRLRLLFDCVCTLTDMGYVVYHGTIDTKGLQAFQEYYVRRLDGAAFVDTAEQERICRGLEAAIHRRTLEEGVCVELSGSDRVGLLSDVTNAFHRHNLQVVSATVSTRGNTALDKFIVVPTGMSTPTTLAPVPPGGPSRSSPPRRALTPPRVPPPAPDSREQRHGQGAVTPTARSSSLAAFPPAGGATSPMPAELWSVMQRRRAEESYVRRVVEKIDQEVGSGIRLTVRPAGLGVTPPGSLPCMVGMDLDGSSSGGSASSLAPRGEPHDATALSPGSTPLHQGQQQLLHPPSPPATSFAQMFLQQSERFFSSLGLGGRPRTPLPH